MISAVLPEDLSAIKELVARSIHECIDVPEEIAGELIEDTHIETASWLNNAASGVHLVYKLNGEVIGIVLVKEYWNMTSLFVCPAAQKTGVGAELVNAALAICREESPIDAVKLNSSSYASGFYRHIGFKPDGEARDLPGGCIPYVYNF